MPDLHELAREEPEAVEAVAERVGGDAGEWLLRVLDENNAD